MPKINEIQKNAIDIIDIIHFFNIYTGYNVFMSSKKFSEEKKINQIFFNDLLDLVNTTLEKNNIPKEKNIFFKHYLYCGIEINLNTINYDKAESTFPNIPKISSDIDLATVEKIEKHKRTFCTSLLSPLLEKINIDFDFYISVLDEIITSLKERNFPSSCYFRLNLRILSFEYPLASINVYKKFLDLGILNNSRYSIKTGNDELLEKIFLRSLLAIEFEIFRDFSISYFDSIFNDSIDLSKFILIGKNDFPSDDHKDSYVKYYKKRLERTLDSYYFNKKMSFYALGDINDRNQIINFLKFMNNNYIHHNFFSNKQANLIGTLGSQLIFYFRYTYSDKKAIYCENKSKNGLTWSEIASNTLKDDGFSVSPRTLYLHYKKLKKINYEQIQLFEMMMHISFGFQWNSSLHDLFLFAYKYDPNKK
jgi:hypothetical protein